MILAWEFVVKGGFKAPLQHCPNGCHSVRLIPCFIDAALWQGNQQHLACCYIPVTQKASPADDHNRIILLELSASPWQPIGRNFSMQPDSWDGCRHTLEQHAQQAKWLPQGCHSTVGHCGGVLPRTLPVLANQRHHLCHPSNETIHGEAACQFAWWPLPDLLNFSTGWAVQFVWAWNINCFILAICSFHLSCYVAAVPAIASQS